ncbi:MAG: NADPH:quinone oxidoreductase family protein [Gammaproteobacteria bacterium]|nr:NADPH:quinone oxidoreductase family protein [Gammaproteobacteria bacterium]NBR16813.1 NADPH:quinone oxidoreductase family protein [Gammaproteobacteria bacterium]NDB17075.1 NADPH:quinone oxidoreductase family protein [Gammaproteobacteria bacterium]NDF85765.1 NADPH:quinone oxidoreductase family protein [Gammaproteobacteria bacterium]
MKALLSEAPGTPDTLVLREIAEPVPGRGQVRIAVRYCGINYPDVLVIEDKYQFKPPRPFAPGSEMSGVIDAVGDGVTAFKVGDAVIAAATSGGLAEKAVTAANACVPMPEGMPFDVAAGLIFTYGTSYHALVNRGELRAGETLLVLGAAGGVGLAAVEIGKALGARVVAAVSSESKAAAAREHGAEVTIIYPREGVDSRVLAAQFKEACGPKGADVIYDPVGGDYAEPALRTAAWKGRYLVIGFPAGIPKIPLNLTLLKGCDIRGVFWGAFRQQEPAQDAANMRALLDLYRAGKIKPKISAILPLPQGGEAIKKLLQREAVGKILVACTA